MPITEAQRHHLITKLEATIGKEAAMTLAEHLPPVGWADVATKTDLDHLRTDLRAEIHYEISTLEAKLSIMIGALDSKIGSLDGKIGSLDGKIGSLDGKIGALDARLTHRMNRAVLTSTVATTGLVLAGMQLIG